jgi:hypothetical protein
VIAGLHHAAKACLGCFSIRGYINCILHLWVIEDKTKDRSVFTIGETVPESVTIHTVGPGQPPEDTAEKVDFTLLVIAIDSLIVHTLVDNRRPPAGIPAGRILLNRLSFQGIESH